MTLDFYRNVQFVPFAILAFLSMQASGQIAFEETTNAAGIDYVGTSFGASWGDLNGDGWLDVWTSSHAEAPKLYVNNTDGTFTAVGGLETIMRDNHGSAWADFDNDGDQDLLMVDGAQSGQGADANEFLVNTNGVLEDRAVEFGLDYPLGGGRTPLWFDWNNDGLLDVFLANTLRSDGMGASAVFTQSAAGGFVLESGAIGLTGTNEFAQLGWQASTQRPMLMIHDQTYPDTIYRYDALPFTDITAEFGFATGVFGARDVAYGDFDNDQREDHFVVHSASFSTAEIIADQLRAAIGVTSEEKGVSFAAASDLITVTFAPSFKVPPANIFIGSGGYNPAAATVTDLSASNPANHGILPHTPGAGFGLYIGYDPTAQTWQVLVNRTGFFTINVIVDSAQPITDLVTLGFQSSIGEKQDILYMNLGDQVIDTTAAAGLATPTPCESAVAADFDNDMDLDLYLVCRGGVDNEPNLLFENAGDATFSLVANAGGAAGSDQGRGETVAFADYDRDGFIDLYVTNGLEAPPFSLGPDQLFRNLGNQNHWLQVDLVGVLSNRDGIGSRVSMTAGGVTQVRLQGGGMHRFSQNQQRLHFGLGTNSQVDQLAVEWPNGVTQVVRNIPADQIFELTQCLGATAIADSTATDIGVAVTIAILDNDQCLEDAPIDVVADDSNSTGTVGSPDPVTSEIVYTPAVAGPDSFEYMLTDASNQQSSAIVSVSVNDLPTAVDDSNTTEVGVAVTVDVLANDTGLFDAPITLNIASAPSDGTATNSDPIVYTPNAGFTGTDSFEYTVSDNNGDASTATVTITVNDPPPPPSGGGGSSAINPAEVLALAFLFGFRRRQTLN